ncbi:MAG: HAD-IC family P-type ATPase [Bacillota bacterium]|uniref:cation-translocating P-type ATPase n=1 Tax=Desulforudis sp. DRI-14 TaxID=3459793 RepID=UPI003476A333
MWHQKTAHETIEELQTSGVTGLTADETARRSHRYGPNEIKEKAKISPVLILINQFRSIIVVLLLAATGISLALGDFFEAAAIFVVIILNAVLGFIMEFRAEQAVSALKKIITPTAKVIRDGHLSEIPARELVPGDLIVLEEGDRVPADARLLEAKELSVIEAALTGESEPVEKNTEPISDPNPPLGDRKNTVFLGTNVARGSGRAVVTATGMGTELGRIAHLLEDTPDEHSPLEKRLERMGRSLVGISLGLAAIIGIAGVLTGNPIGEMVVTAIALAIAAVPEGLPAVATITLAIGMQRMARQNAIVRRLPAVETLGSTTVICTDKTGTITENRMRVETIWLPGREIQISGEGYVPTGGFTGPDGPIDVQADHDLKLFLQAGALSSKAGIQEDDNGEWDVIGDPTEGALVVAAAKAGFQREQAERSGYTWLGEVPFSSETRRSAAFYRLPDGTGAVFAKGAPGAILDVCSRVRIGGREIELNEELRKKIMSHNDALARRGLRLLAVAYKICEDTDSPFADLVFLGLAGISDPPRPEVAAAVAEAQRAGIRVMMITGDQPATAEAIGERIGLKGEVVHGRDLDGLSAGELEEKVKKASIFARVSPRNKLDIVNVLKNNREIVAMTGDGVNDAPALKRADIGVAMGRGGTAVAREASDMVLADDNFATIIRAVKQGRIIFDNVQKFIQYMFSCNLSEIALIFVAIIIGLPLPLVVLQILWMNLVTDVFPALALGWEPGERGIMCRPPRNPRQDILTAKFKLTILLHGSVLSLGPLFIFIYALNNFTQLEVARTLAFATLAVTQVGYALNVRRRNGLGLDRTLLENPYMIGAVIITLGLQFAAVHVPGLNDALSAVPLGAGQWAMVFLGAVLPNLLIYLLNRLPYFQDQAGQAASIHPETERRRKPREDAPARQRPAGALPFADCKRLR